jgi:DNA polymerase III epsilon subunit-like protein
MQALIIDFEGTGLDTSKESIIEIGAQLVDDKFNPLSSLSVLVRAEQRISPEIEKITGITQAEVDAEGIPLGAAMGMLSHVLTDEVGYIIAYNREYDEALFRTEMVRHEICALPSVNQVLNLPWLCAMRDIERNYEFKCWKLSHLALDYGIAVDPAKLHRAINDVELTRKMLQASGVTALQMYQYQTTPWAYLQALIPAPWTDGGKGKAEASKLGYSWEKAKGTDAPVFEKAWVKRVKEHKIEDELKQAPFQVRQLKA